jgi:predicted PurR-regulated permease PerM
MDSLPWRAEGHPGQQAGNHNVDHPAKQRVAAYTQCPSDACHAAVSASVWPGIKPAGEWSLPSIFQSMSARLFFVVGTITAVIVALYFAQPVLLPLTVSALLAFLLTPIVKWFEQKGLPRLVAVIVLVTVACTGLGGLGYVVGDQLVAMADELPRYEHNLKQRIYSIRGQSAGFEKFADTVEDLKKATENATNGDTAGEAGEATAAGDREADPSSQNQQPVPVKVTSSPSFVTQFGSYLAPALNPVATFGMIVLFTLFMLVQPLQLGDRLGWLLGAGHVEITRSMLDEAGSRISSYLLMQLVISAMFGIATAVGLWLFGLPGALLWGLVAGLARFIPYVGPWIGDGLPILVSLAVFPNWTQPLGITAMFIVFELISNNLIEPWLYGASTGLSPLAVLLAMAFWGWLWGGVGLLLAVPMTVCLVVAGKYIPALRVFTVMLGDRQMVQSHAMFYQMLTAGQHEEARQTLQTHAEHHGVVAALDEYWLAALALAGEDHRKARLDDQQLTRLTEDAETLAAQMVQGNRASAGEVAQSAAPCVARCIPTNAVVDQVVASVLATVLANESNIQVTEPDGATATPATRQNKARQVLINLNGVARTQLPNGPPTDRCLILASPLRIKARGRLRRWWRAAECSPNADTVCTFQEILDRLRPAEAKANPQRAAA